MLGILAKSFNTAARLPHWEASAAAPIDQTELFRHERRKREELHRAKVQAQRFKVTP